MPSSIFLHLVAAAPEKPPVDAPCNGCGVCCSLSTCPLGRLRFWQIAGPCPALHWSADEMRYHCGLLLHPQNHLPLPERWAASLRPFIARKIAAGAGCDCTAQVESESA
ncbi:hypothetical protein [Azonexus sp.]|uniref:hypothetical protein n=1 Tax=Azonexus sp. TaxID=1872668 RepID=UPI0039E252C6